MKKRMLVVDVRRGRRRSWLGLHNEVFGIVGMWKQWAFYILSLITILIKMGPLNYNIYISYSVTL